MWGDGEASYRAGYQHVERRYYDYGETNEGQAGTECKDASGSDCAEKEGLKERFPEGKLVAGVSSFPSMAWWVGHANEVKSCLIVLALAYLEQASGRSVVPVAWLQGHQVKA